MIRRGLIVGLLLATACAVPMRVETFGPDFDGARTIRMRGNVLPTPVDGIGGVELNAERVERPQLPFEYALLVEVRAEDLRIRPGRSLRVAIGGDTLLLARDSTATTWPRVDPTVREQARYPVSDSILRRIAAADEVAVGVRGAGWWERRRLQGPSLENLREWVNLYVSEDSLGRGEPAVPASSDR